jgi:phage gp36-like protein
VADVEQLMQVNIKQAGTPDRADVEEIIDDVAAELDGIAQASGYTVPVTNAEAVALMKRYNRMCAAVAVWHAGFVSDTAPARVEYWNTQCEGFKARLRKGEQELPGLEPLSDIDPAFEISTFPNRDRYWRARELDENA